MFIVVFVAKRYIYINNIVAAARSAALARDKVTYEMWPE